MMAMEKAMTACPIWMDSRNLPTDGIHDAPVQMLKVRMPVAAMLRQMRDHLNNEYFVSRTFIFQNYEK